MLAKTKTSVQNNHFLPSRFSASFFLFWTSNLNKHCSGLFTTKKKKKNRRTQDHNSTWMQWLQIWCSIFQGLDLSLNSSPAVERQCIPLNIHKISACVHTQHINSIVVSIIVSDKSWNKSLICLLFINYMWLKAAQRQTRNILVFLKTTVIFFKKTNQKVFGSIPGCAQSVCQIT